jgi:hypothetical protein
LVYEDSGDFKNALKFQEESMKIRESYYIATKVTKDWLNPINMLGIYIKPLVVLKRELNLSKK